jgi:hypothetical protein
MQLGGGARPLRVGNQENRFTAKERKEPKVKETLTLMLIRKKKT